MNDKVYIIILNYNGWKDTIECLESVLKNDYEDYQIIVVDNDSPNNSMDYIINWAEGKQDVIYTEDSQLKHLSQPFEPKPLEYVYYTKEEALSGGDVVQEKKYKNPIIFIQAGENGGFAAGNNIGIKYALEKNDFEYIWLLNNDTVIEKESLLKFVKSFENKLENQKIGILGSVQYYYHNPEKIQASAGGFDKWTGSFWNYQTLNFEEEEIAFIYGASMFISKNIFEKVGFLNEGYFMYYEEIDLSERLKKINCKYLVDKRLKVYHKHGNTIQKNGYDFKFYFLFKNRIVFYKKYYKNIFLISIVSIIKQFVQFQIIAIIKKRKKLKLKTLIESIKDGLREDV